MRLKFIGCKVLNREIAYLTAKSKNNIDITWLRQGYHNEPDVLRKTLQEEINKIDAGEDPHSGETLDYGWDFDAIILGYGLCSNGVCGVSSKKYRIVLPRAHDCITLLLGSKEKYAALFSQNNGGVFWYSSGWIENSLVPSEDVNRMMYRKYSEEYGEENAAYLVDLEQTWMKEYNCCGFIRNPCATCAEHLSYTKKAAAYLNWSYREYEGNLCLLEQLLEGEWNEESFLIIPAGSEAEPSYDSSVVRKKQKD